MRGLAVFAAILIAPLLRAEEVAVAGLRKPVEILRDRWGVPHIYAQTVEDLFFAQGYITARDRLFQIDLWRRIGTGKLAEALGPAAIDRDKLARSVRWRGPMEIGRASCRERVEMWGGAGERKEKIEMTSRGR